MNQKQASLKQVSKSTLEVELTMDVHTMNFPEGSLHVNSAKGRAHLLHMKNLSLNLVALPIQTLHELHQGVSEELRFREQCTLLIINEVKTNNQHMFEEKEEVAT